MGLNQSSTGEQLESNLRDTGLGCRGGKSRCESEGVHRSVAAHYSDTVLYAIQSDERHKKDRCWLQLEQRQKHRQEERLTAAMSAVARTTRSRSGATAGETKDRGTARTEIERRDTAGRSAAFYMAARRQKFAGSST